jgi:hypothetical protein
LVWGTHFQSISIHGTLNKELKLRMHTISLLRRNFKIFY